MKSVAPGVFTANFSDFGAETSAFCNHAAQIAQVADEANISIFEREGMARTKNDGSRVDFRRSRKTKITLYKFSNA
ncbi:MULTISPECIES: hypothetical protein [Rhizobium]|jgi:hypothetical protein|uniref:hypothetical protein n=1 Tax=Rhizobium TaxID=379 RepID=UPI0013EE3F44|nr:MULTISPECIES: hypothetical protein [Rhizobium]WSH55570.1 hypothetical protein U8Q06_32860 [Rhizobium beringeri]